MCILLCAKHFQYKKYKKIWLANPNDSVTRAVTRAGHAGDTNFFPDLHNFPLTEDLTVIFFLPLQPVWDNYVRKTPQVSYITNRIISSYQNGIKSGDPMST